MCRVTPPTCPAKLHKLKAYVTRYVQKHFSPINKVASFEEWIEKVPYSGPRKEELNRVYRRTMGRVSKHDCQKVNSFIKIESYPEYKYPRWINSRSDAFKVYSGPWFKEIEEAVFALPYFIKHVPTPERPALITDLKRPGRKYRATDYSSFEAHFTPEVLESVELVLYDHMLQNFPDVQKTIHNTLCGTNKCKTRQGVSMTMKGRRMSGDMCTSLGNGFTNLMIWSYLYDEINHNDEWEGYFEGDDAILAFSGEAPTAEHYAELGFTIKIEEVQDPELASFCGLILADGQVLRSPTEFLQTFGWTSRNIKAGTKVRHELLRAKALSACYESPNCPIIGAIARRALQVTQGYKARWDTDWKGNRRRMAIEKMPRVPAFSPSPRTRQVFEDLYSIPADVQQILEQRILDGSDDNLALLSEVLCPHRDVLHTWLTRNLLRTDQPLGHGR